MGALVDVKIPDIGEFHDVEVIEVMVKPGDEVHVDDSLVTIESDKASMEVPSTASGVVKEIQVKIGDKVSEGSPIVRIETTSSDRPEGRAPAPAASKPKLAAVPPSARPAQGSARPAEPPKAGAAAPSSRPTLVSAPAAPGKS